MTANNVITASTCAVLFADTAVYDDGGVIVGFESKVRVNRHHRWAAMCTGWHGAATVFGDVLEHADLTYDQVVDCLPRMMEDAPWGYDIENRDDHRHFGIVVAGFSDNAGTWCMAKVATREQGGVLAFVAATQAKGLFRPPFAPAGQRDLTHEELDLNIKTVGLDEFGRRVLVNQRHVHQMEDVGGPSKNCAVGGEGEIVVLTREAVYRRTIAKWFDVAGEDRKQREARVAREPRAEFVRLSRAERRRNKRAA